MECAGHNKVLSAASKGVICLGFETDKDGEGVGDLDRIVGENDDGVGIDADGPGGKNVSEPEVPSLSVSEWNSFCVLLCAKTQY